MTRSDRSHRVPAMAVAAAVFVGLTACSGSSDPAPVDATATTAASGAADVAVAPPVTVSLPPGVSPPPGASLPPGVILPVSGNPINNTSTAELLRIDSVLVENNEDPATGKAVDDHLEIALSNTGGADLGGFEVYYTFTDPAEGITENYYAVLPADFTIPAGGTRVAHFDNTGAPDHFPINEFNLYKATVNALDVTVVVSAAGAAPQTATVKKDAGGEETAD